jgi:hypothetical protein
LEKLLLLLLLMLALPGLLVSLACARALLLLAELWELRWNMKESWDGLKGAGAAGAWLPARAMSKQ